MHRIFPTANCFFAIGISRAEFLERENRLFNRLDSDEDGVVTPAELDAAVERRQDRRFWWRD